MSSTRNVQDLLVNVFRPTYKWDSTNGFVPSLVISNVSELITDRLRTGSLAVGDTTLNTYIGSNAGTTESTQLTASNVAIGFSAMNSAFRSSNNVSIGFSNFNALSNATSNVGIGPATTMGRGGKNILIGPNLTLGDGSGNIVIGSDIAVGSVNNRLQLGTLVYGDFAAGYLGLGTSTPTTSVDISGQAIFRNKVGIQKTPAYSLDVNGAIFASERYYGAQGTGPAPIYTFKDVSGSGLYQATDASYGTGALGFSVNQSPRLIVASNKAYLYGGLDVCGAVNVQSGDATGVLYVGGSTTGVLLQRDLLGNGYLRPAGSGVGLYLGSSNSNTMKVTTSGVGILTDLPAYALDICGTVRALEGLKQGTNTWGSYSDRRIKQDIQAADTSLCYSIVKNLPLQRFTWDVSYLPTIKDRNSVGWIAQDVEQVFPRAVATSAEFGLTDLRILDVDQIYKTMYGALEKVIADKEALETKAAAQDTLLQSILTRLTALEASLQSSG